MKSFALAVRALRRNPGYSTLAIVTLALGIGCCATVFTLLDAVYFRPLPIKAPDQLVRLNLHSPKMLGGLSYTEYRQLAERVPALQDVIAIGRRGVTFHQNDEALPLIIHYVSGNYFDSLGIPLYLGRGLRSSDDTFQATTPTVVINYHLWTEQLGRRADVINSTIQLMDTAFTVVGVTAPGFLGLDRLQRTDVWVPVSQADFVIHGMRQSLDSPFNRWFDIIGRVRPGSEASVSNQLKTLLSNWSTDHAEQYNAATLTASSYLDEDRQGQTQGAVFLTLVGLVLLIACANVANLVLARNEARRREIAVRTALGAGRGTLIRDALVEALLLSGAASVVGLFIASWAIGGFSALVPESSYGLVLDVRMDARLFEFSAILSLLTFVLIGVIPAWRRTRPQVMTSLKLDLAGSRPQRRLFAARDMLVVAQLALSVTVVIAAAMLFRTLTYGRHINPGFDTHKNVDAFYIVPQQAGYDTAGTYRFLETMRQELASVPGVVRTSYAIRLPAQSNEAGWAEDFTIPGKQPPAGEQFFRIKYTMVGPAYFATMGTHIDRGRGIDESDLPNSRRVVVINEAMAHRFWPDENPVGKTITIGGQKPSACEIIGVAEDNKIVSLYEDPQMYVYVPYSQDAQYFAQLLVETAPGVAPIPPAVREKVAAFDPRIRILSISSISNHMQLVLFGERRDALVAGVLSVLSLFLSVVGVYGVVSLVTRRRVREIGIRMALGARRSDVVGLVVGRSWVVSATGIAAGIAGGVLMGRLLQSRLHGVAPFDILSILIATFTLFGAATLASLIPSWRAARIDPNQALRYE